MNSHHPSNRRDFFTKGAFALASANQLGAQSHGGDGDPFRIGCLNVHNYSHLLDLWAPLMNPRKEKKESSMTGMRITHCWEVDPAKSAEFAKMYGCEAVRNFDGMLGKVDGIISGGYFEHPWNHRIHQPYLEAGLPNLINRPFANSVAKARQMIDTARKHGATIMCPSAFEYNEAAAHAKAWVTGKKILCYSATNSFDDYPTHGVHGIYMIHRAIVESGNPIVSVAYQAKNWHTPPGVMTFEHQGVSGNSFLGTLHQIAGQWASLQIHTPEQYDGKSFNIVSGTGFPFNVTEAWAPTIWAYQRMAMHKEMPESFDEILGKTRIFLAGWQSVLNGGKTVRLDEVPEVWEAPVDLPSRPGDPYTAMFKKLFG
jgi:predicted dehydrogenase